MRVTLLSQYYPPERGAVRYGHELAKGLSAAGHTVTVVAGIPHFPKGTPYEGYSRWRISSSSQDGVHVIRLPLVMGSNAQPFRRMLGFATFAVSAFLCLLSMPHQDFVIASVPPPTTSLAALLVSWLRKSTFIVLLRDIEPLRSLSQRGYADSWAGRALIRVFIRVYKSAKRVVIVHPAEADILLPYGFQSQRLAVIPHGVDMRADVEVPDDPSDALPRRHGRLLALYAGTIGLVHGLTTLVESFSEERIGNLPVDLAIVGDGQYAGACRDIIRRCGMRNVHVLPSVPQEDIRALLQQADILVCSFRNEANVPLGSKFYEYCAAGKPILVHGHNLAGRLVSEIGNGLSCDAGDIHGLETALREFMSQPAARVAMGQRGQEYARRHFSQALRNEQWANLISDVSGHNAMISLPAGLRGRACEN